MGACFPRKDVPPEDSVRCVEVLLADARGRATISSQNDDGDTALHLALERRDLPLAALLVRAGAPVDVPNNKGLTPKQLADSTSLDLPAGPR